MALERIKPLWYLERQLKSLKSKIKKEDPDYFLTLEQRRNSHLPLGTIPFGNVKIKTLIRRYNETEKAIMSRKNK